MSAVTAASVSGMPRSAARLSAMREQPADPAGDRVLGHRRVGELAELLQRGLAVLQPQPPGLGEVVGHVVAEDLQRPLHPRAGGHRGPGRAAQVGVVEVGQPVGGGPHLAAHPPLLPGQHALVRADPGEQRADRVAVPDHDPVRRRAPRAPWPAMPSRRAAPTSASAASGPGQVISSADERPGSVSEPCARNAPRQAASASHTPPETTCGGSPRTGRPRCVEQAGLAGQPLAVA